MNSVSLEWIANCGILVTLSENTRILIDGIFGPTPYFSPLPKTMKKAVFGMGEAYRNIEYLLFTHRHEDHFDAGMSNAYVQNNQVRQLIVPLSGTDPRSYLENRGSLKSAEEKQILVQPSPETGGRCHYVLEKGIEAEYISCGHLDERTYPAVRHCSLLLKTGPYQFWFAADSDASEKNAEILSDIKSPDAVFVTPLFYLNPRGRAILRRMGPKRTVLYHIPLDQDDVTGLKELAQKQKTEHSEDRSLLIFSETDQQRIIIE